MCASNLEDKLSHAFSKPTDRMLKSINNVVNFLKELTISKSRQKADIFNSQAAKAIGHWRNSFKWHIPGQ